MAIDPQMTEVVEYLKANQAEIAEGTFCKAQRPWMNFKDIEVVGQFEFKGLKKIFDRKASNDEYGSLREQQNALAKNLQTAKLSGDFLAGMERDTRMRRRSRVRMLVHAGNRAAANGQDTGPLRRNTLDWLGRILAEEQQKR